MAQSRRGSAGAGKGRGEGGEPPRQGTHEEHGDHGHRAEHEHGAEHGQGAEHEHGAEHREHDRHGNPLDLAAYLARLESGDRIAWQKPDEVVRLLGVRRGDRVCDVGAGPGYFALRLARAVGAQGEVYAFDAEPRMLAVLRQRMHEHGLFNVRPILAEEGVPPRPCDVVLVVNAFHHFRDGPGYLRRLAEHLKPGGRIVNIDFHKRELPVGPPLEHKVAREDFLAAATAAGLRLVAEHDVLPYQYFLVLEPGAVAGTAGSAGAAPPAPGAAAAPRPAAAPERAGAGPRRRGPKAAAGKAGSRRKGASAPKPRRPPGARAGRRPRRR